MKYKIVISCVLVMFTVMSLNIDCKYYMYLTAYQKYLKNKDFENLKDLLIKSLEVSKEKLKIINLSSEYDLDKYIEKLKKINDIKLLKKELEVIKIKTDEINRKYLLYLIKKYEKNNSNLRECMMIIGNINNVDFENLKNTFLMCMKTEIKKNQSENNGSIYEKLYVQLFEYNNYPEVKRYLKNVSNPILKKDIEKYIEEQQKGCNDPICDINQYNLIKKELFVMICDDLGGKFDEYVQDKRIYYGCAVNRIPNSTHWMNVSNNIYKLIDVDLDEESYNTIIKRLNVSL